MLTLYRIWLAKIGNRMRNFKIAFSLAALIVTVIDGQSTMAQPSTSRASEDQVKASVQRLAESTICQNGRLLNSAGVDRKQCEFGISTFSSYCWRILDRWVSDYSMTDTSENRARYERIADVYIICQESKLLKAWISQRAETSN